MERRLLRFSALEIMENKKHSGQGNVQAGRNACHVVCSFPCKKASQMSVRPFWRGEFTRKEYCRTVHLPESLLYPCFP